jgi:hypothetical protein
MIDSVASEGLAHHLRVSQIREHYHAYHLVVAYLLVLSTSASAGSTMVSFLRTPYLPLSLPLGFIPTILICFSSASLLRASRTIRWGA